MDPAGAQFVANLALGYAAIGLAVAAAFLIFGIGRVASAARGSFAFRILLVPGSVLLWPFVLRRWASLARTPS